MLPTLLPLSQSSSSLDSGYRNNAQPGSMAVKLVVLAAVSIVPSRPFCLCYSTTLTHGTNRPQSPAGRDHALPVTTPSLARTGYGRQRLGFLGARVSGEQEDD